MPYMTMDNNGELHGLFKRVRKAVSRTAKKVGRQVKRTAKQAGSFVKRSSSPSRLAETLAPKRLFSPKRILARWHKASVTPLFMGRFIEKKGYSNILTNPPSPDVLFRSMTSSRYKKKMMQEAQAKAAAEMPEPTYVDARTGKVIPKSEMSKYYKPGEEPLFVDADGNPIPPDQLHLYQLPGVKSGGVNPS